MCIIIYTPDGKIPRKHLQRSLQTNPDGWGFMFVREQQIVVRKGMSVREFWKVWREEQPSGPTVFHSRIGTQGSKSIKNCHPFVVPNHNVAVVHNGILNQHCDENNPINDTQLFVWDVLANLPENFLRNEGILTMLSDYIRYGKLVFISTTGKVTIINENLGVWSNGRWYSNRSYLPAPKPTIAELVNRLPKTTPFWEVPLGGYKK